MKDRLLKGWKPEGNATSFKNHLDGYNQPDYLTGKSPKSARSEFFYFNNDGDRVAIRYDDWKVVFHEKRVAGGFQVLKEPFVILRAPKLFNLRIDPYERADIVCDQYYDWMVKNDYLLVKGQLKAATFLETFEAYPPSQPPASFNIEGVRAQVDKVIAAAVKKSGSAN